MKYKGLSISVKSDECYQENCLYAHYYICLYIVTTVAAILHTVGQLNNEEQNPYIVYCKRNGYKFFEKETKNKQQWKERTN